MAQRSQFAIRLLPSLTDFAFLMPVVFLFGRMEGAKTLLSDCDTGWHIRTGEWILANHWVPVHDIFSYSKPGGLWYAWEWLSEILFAWLNALGGLQAVAFFGLLLISTTFALLFRRVRLRANVVVAIVVTMLAAVASSIHWLARPHLITLLFLVLFHAALEEVRQGRGRIRGVSYLVLLPFFTILWTNLHAGFIVGIVMLVLYAAGDLATVALTADAARRRPAWRRARAYLLSALACLAASLVNPYTYHLHEHVIQYLRDPYQAQHIVEFLSISFHHPMAIFFEVLLLGAAATAVWSASRGRYTETVYLLAWGHAALLASRNIPIFAIVAAPPVAAAVEEWLARVPQCNLAGWLRGAAGRFNGMAAETGETDGIPRWHLVSVVGMLAVAALLWAPHPPKGFRAEFDPSFYPAAAIGVLNRDAQARIFTNDEWGDYLIYRMYPGHKVFIDGRSDFYGPVLEKKYMDVLDVKWDWESTLGGFGVDTILLPPTAPLAGALKESSRWHVVYDDGVSLVFRPGGRAVAGETNSVTNAGGGEGRDREVTKTQARDQAITEIKSKT